MSPILSAYKKVKCPDGPRFILKEPERAFSIHASDWEVRVKALVKFFEKIQTDAEVGIKKRAKSVVKELTENYATLQAHYQAAYVMYASNPCDKKIRRRVSKSSEGDSRQNVYSQETRNRDSKHFQLEGNRSKRASLSCVWSRRFRAEESLDDGWASRQIRNQNDIENWVV